MRAGRGEVDREEREDGQIRGRQCRGNVQRRGGGSFRSLDPAFPLLCGQNLETVSARGGGGGIERCGGDGLRGGRSRFVEEEVGRGRGGNGRQEETGGWVAVALSKRDSRHFCRACRVQGYRMHQAHRGQDR